MEDTISREKALEILNETQGKIFTAVFTKKNGEKRRMNARINVKKGVKGVGMSYNPVERKLLPVYDMQKEGFRMIDLSTLEEVIFRGKHIKFTD